MIARDLEARSGERIVDEPLLAVRKLQVRYGTKRRQVVAVDDVSLELHAGRTLGVVGESGSGKTTLARSIIGLSPVTGGSIHLCGKDITHAKGGRRRALAREIQYVFQDPYSSLNPTKTIEQTMLEPLLAQADGSRHVRKQRVAEMLELVGLSGDAGQRFPRSFSGGQRQRIAIARALILGPALLICDEPTASLDLSIQAQILDLLKRMQAEFSIGMLFIAHNLDVVRYMADRTMVMRAGVVVEEGTAEQIALHPRDVYTQALIASTPLPHPHEQAMHRAERQKIITASGAIRVP